VRFVEHGEHHIDHAVERNDDIGASQNRRCFGVHPRRSVARDELHESQTPDQSASHGSAFLPRVRASRHLDELVDVRLEGETRLETTDSTYRCGLLGLRVVDTSASFDDFHVSPLK
jgi:hypothetical protein